ncbi:unnamed protein product [Macrosiphum euphorbiae]|uniref:Uncharacterized protein n=1 Tax=Macrosiphum euphorbiae TaxID=13131 RepID=A0AAV0X4Y8_9HEMI|nr:unnamed protein product [Macrosiphum euphorbiae]
MGRTRKHSALGSYLQIAGVKWTVSGYLQIDDVRWTVSVYLRNLGVRWRPITREPTDEDIRINVNMSQIGGGGDDLTFGSAAILYSSVPPNCDSGFDFFRGSGGTRLKTILCIYFVIISILCYRVFSEPMDGLRPLRFDLSKIFE